MIYKALKMGVLAFITASLSIVAANNYAQPRYNQYNRYNQYGRNFHGNVFRPPRSIIPPSYYRTILSNFQQCKTYKCNILGKGYSTDIKQCMATLGAYTSCVTACAAAEMLRTTIDFKNLIAKIYAAGRVRLVQTRQYLAGEEEFNVIGNRTRIEDSCCLPNDYFAEWSRITFPVSTAKGTRMISVKSYIEYCSKQSGSNSDGLSEEFKWLSSFEVQCNAHSDHHWIAYLEQLQRNMGHLILSTKCRQLAPDNACSKKYQSNPRADEFPEDVCVAESCDTDGRTEKISMPLIKPIVNSKHWKDSCPADKFTSNGKTLILKFSRVQRHALKLFTVTNGLPSISEDGAMNNGQAPSCNYTQKLAVKTADFYESAPVPSHDAIKAAERCPHDGLLEYCNMKQYSSFLQTQLFDHTKCSIEDMNNNAEDSPLYYESLACLYKIFTLKCDCMEAVLNCYEREYKFTKSLSKTIGKAASILCGFILCQRPKVFSLLGGQQAIENARIMREMLQQVGVSVPEVSSIPPATFAFLSFGLGMVAFVVTKAAIKQYKRSPVEIENGYQNLI